MTYETNPTTTTSTTLHEGLRNAAVTTLSALVAGLAILSASKAIEANDNPVHLVDVSQIQEQYTGQGTLDIYDAQ